MGWRPSPLLLVFYAPKCEKLSQIFYAAGRGHKKTDRAKTQEFLLDKGVVSTIDVPDAFATSTRRINARGQIVGAYSDVSHTRPNTPLRGFLLEDGVFTRIDVPGASEPLPEGINDRGQIMGTYRGADGITHGFLLDDGVFTTIDHPDAASETVLFDINNRAQIIGGYTDTRGTVTYFLSATGRGGPDQADDESNDSFGESDP